MNHEKLSVGDFGEEVSRLHENLKSHGLEVSNEEMKRKFFGPSTREAVGELQKARGIEPSCEICEKTAAVLSSQPGQTSAAVVSSNPAPAATDVPGAGGPPPVSLRPAVPAIPSLREPRPSTDGADAGKEMFIVEGKVVSRSRAGVGGLRVEIVDKNVCQDVRLAEAVTNADGGYRSTFPITDLHQRGKQQPDLQARAFAGQTMLGASEVRYNSSNRETLNVLLTEKAASVLPSEHETLTGVLSAHFKGNLRDLKETDECQDITYLANKTGWDARVVALAALADQFSQRASNAKIAPVFFYALFRAGLPANEDTLYHSDAWTLKSVWEKAAQQGVIPKSLTETIPTVVKQFQTLSAQKMLTGPALAGASPLKEMLTASRLNDAQQAKFVELYAAHRTDMPAFWKTIGDAFGKDTANRLQVDGKLGFLTINNAPLMQKLHKVGGDSGLSDPLQLAQHGYHRAALWSRLLDGNVPVPKEIPGDTPEAKQANYAEYLAAQIRLSYPTASVAQMVKSGDLLLTGAAPGVSDQVHAFLTEQQGKFEIGMQPVQQYIARNKLKVTEETVTQVKRLQRVYQITPSDLAMTGLLKRGIDAAYHVARYEKEVFVQTYQQELAGAQSAAQIYDKSVQAHNAVLNIAISYLTARTAPGIGVHSPAQIVNPTPANAGDVIAYGTLESLFGSMDFCACEHCRSILSPAAYLVDLLLFIGPDGQAWAAFLANWKSNHAGAPYPFLDQATWNTYKNNWNTMNPGQPIPNTEISPLEVLLSRRSDIHHLPLTCENTNTALPYIDVVNETLEYFIANSVQKLSLNGYLGHDTNGAASADLLASPQFVIDSAYTTLRGERFPSPLPFHQPLENLRLYFDRFEAPLPLAMERLRKSDDLERGANPYGWRDILMEEIGLSRAEYDLLTTSNPAPKVLEQIYGFPAGTSDPDVIAGIPNVAGLSNAKQFTRRVGITYEEIVSILKTRFVNPNSDLIPKLERLGVPFTELKKLKDTNTSAADAAFDALLPTGASAPDPFEFGGDIKAWVKRQDNYDRIMRIITLTDPTGNPDPCSFDDLEFRYSRPMTGVGDTSTRLSAVEFVRLLRFIRLWKKTGWTIEQTDAAICALFPQPTLPQTFADTIDTVEKLDAGLLMLLPRLGIVVRVMNALNLTPKKDLLSLLACWSPLGTHGDSALYRQMFLNPALLKQDDVFADNGYGEFLEDSTKKLADHAEALRSAFNLTGDEYGRIVTALSYDANTPLTIPNISAVYRRGYLARKLRLSVRELLLFTQLTGLDPFVAPDLTDPAILRLISLVQALKDRSLKSAVALYLIWNQDLSGKSAPASAQVTEFARTLRGDFVGIEDQFAATEDPSGDIARARMTLVYGQEASDAFFSLLDDIVTLDVAYTHSAPALEAAITSADSRIAYDDFRHRLSYSGVLTAVKRDALKAGTTAAFQMAMDVLFAKSEDTKGSFFSRYPELKPLFDAYIASSDPPATKRSALLTAFRPELSRRRKRQQALQRLSAAAGIDLAFTQTLLDPFVAPFPLHAAGHADQPALNDVLAVETPGLGARFFFRDTATGIVDLNVPAAGSLDYNAVNSNQLPANPTPGAAVSGIWSGQIETTEAGFCNLVVETDTGATVTLTLGGQVRPLTQNGNIYRNTDPLEFKAGTLYDIELKVEKIKNRLSVKWDTPKRPREVIPSRYLYPPTILAPFTDVYTRFLKTASLAGGLNLTAKEIGHFAADSDYLIAGDEWLNTLPVNGDPAVATAVALVKPLRDLLDYARIKAELSPDDETLLAIIKDPVAATVKSDGPLFALTRWDRTSLTNLLAHFGGNIVGLTHFYQFRRIYDAFALIQKMGISADALIKVTTNEPTGDTVLDFQAALRARYDAAAWRDVVQPINDTMRGVQRDALVSYILHQMRSNPASAHVDTADKLFEYFLMDVQMEPCMQTSRIRHALSSVQLFIERCLMNLEPRVSPASIIAKQWEWMKRYRVWEANRKVFLYPENWAEPELRDDQSPFFKETMSELLQGDITEDRAAVALLNYLSKLEEVAKLEPCGIHYVENDPGASDDIAHVVARTTGANRKYFYRRREFGYWTPWEQIKLEIEDNPVIPVVWNGRLFLFWLRIMKQAPIDPNALPASSSTPDSVTSLSLGQIKADAKSSAQNNVKVTVQAVLCWSEYFNGKWQPTRTSDIDRPLTLGPSGVNAFDRSKLKLSVFFWTKGALRIIVSNAIGTGSSFFLHNVYSAPELREPKKEMHFVPKRTLETSTDSFKVSYINTNAPHSVLNNSINDRTVEPNHPLNGNPWDAPFFYEDGRHVFYVTTAERIVEIPQWNDFGIVAKPPKVEIEIPSLVLEVPEIIPDLVGPVSRRPGFGVVDPSPIEHVISEDAYIRRGIGTLGTVRFGESEIGPAGSLMRSVQKR